MSKEISFKKFFIYRFFFCFNRDDPYENIEAKYKILQQKDDQVNNIFIY
jgi:hypothetical protein